MPICAVVVTFNRKRVLAQCIQSLRDGSRVPDNILVVDNASTDGTLDFVRDYFPQTGISLLRLNRNMGGAGGFKAGIEAAIHAGSDLIWVMDDDHEVGRDSLSVMTDMMQRTGVDVVGPVVMSPARDGTLSWPLGPGGRGYQDYSSVVRDYGTSGAIPQIPATFNAVLYRQQVFNQLGLPDERLFIRGDEIEYAYRMEKRRTKSVVATGALVYHPPTRHQCFLVLHIGKRRLEAPHVGDQLKDYCLSRNRAFYFKKYGVYKSLLLDAIRFPLFFLMVRKFDLAGFGLWLRGYLHGLTGRFGYEKRFLQH